MMLSFNLAAIGLLLSAQSYVAPNKQTVCPASYAAARASLSGHGTIIGSGWIRFIEDRKARPVVLGQRALASFLQKPDGAEEPRVLIIALPGSDITPYTDAFKQQLGVKDRYYYMSKDHGDLSQIELSYGHGEFGLFGQRNVVTVVCRYFK